MESKGTFSEKKWSKKWGDYDSDDDDDEKKNYTEEKKENRDNISSGIKYSIVSNHIITEESALKG